MTDQQVLEKAIQKAIDGGWDILDRYEVSTFSVHNNGHLLPAVWFGEGGNHTQGLVTEQIIFNHDFAKALWGEDGEGIMHGGSGRIGWRHHLARMVVAEYPIKYLAENI